MAQKNFLDLFSAQMLEPNTLVPVIALYPMPPFSRSAHTVCANKTFGLKSTIVSVEHSLYKLIKNVIT